nr:hypothetical protein [Acinetobacter sp. Marseille-Q1620]
MLKIFEKLFVYLFLIGICNVSNANNSEEKLQILNVIKKYAESVSCENTFEKNAEVKRTNIDDVYLISSDKDLGDTTYFVFWAGDIGCNLGTGTQSYYMSEVSRFSNNRPFLVKSDFAFGEDIDINFRFIESVKQTQKNQFEIISWNYADDKYGGKDGGNSFPANKFKYVLKNAGNGWKIINQSLIKQNK